MIGTVLNYAINQFIITLDIQIMLEALGIDYSREGIKAKMISTNNNYNQGNSSWVTNNNNIQVETT